MAYLTAHRYGLTKAAPTWQEEYGRWAKVWTHPSGLRALKHPVTGRWVVGNGHEVFPGFCSSLRAAAAKIERMVSR